MPEQRSNVFGSPSTRRLVQPTHRGAVSNTRPSAPKQTNQYVPPPKPLPLTNAQVHTQKPAQQSYTASQFAALTNKQPRQTYVATATPKVPVLQRETSQTHTLQPSKSRKTQYALIATGVTVFIVGSAVSFMSFRTNKQVVAQVQGVATSASQDDENAGDNPKEDPIDKQAVANYKVAPDAPRRLAIPKIGVDSRIMHLGVKTNSELKAPSNIYDSGWYNASAKPGEPGAMLIDGHVHGPTKPGIFYGLKKLTNGDVIDVERGDGKVIKYKVVKSQVYDAAQTDMTAAMTPIVAGKPGLNLITCAGKLDKKTNLYNERLIVFATLME